MNGKRCHSLEVLSGLCVIAVKVASWVTQGWTFAVRLGSRLRGLQIVSKRDKVDDPNNELKQEGR